MSDFNEVLKLKGAVTLQMFDEIGNLIHEQCNPNLIVTVGKNYLANWLAASSQSGEFMSYVGLGTASTTFTIITVTDGTHLVVSSTTGMASGDVLNQGANTTTITSVTDSTHLVVGSTAGFTAASATFEHLPNSTDTALQSELSGGGYSRQQGTLSSSSNVWQNVVTFGAGNGTGAVAEAGLFSVSSSGTMFARNVFGVVTKGAGNSLIVTWQVTVS